jgi:outer membrane lipoprotein carrier protein
VTRHLLCTLFALVPAIAADVNISKTLKDIEERYNAAKTLQVSFSETVVQQGRRRTESGDLYLRKPGRMRWAYSNPAGKLFVSDGKDVYFYSPASNRAEKMKLKETEDLRAPMAFLLGKLDFNRDFKEFRSKQENGKLMITAVPKSDKMPYREVAFQLADGNRIERLIVTGQDASILDFTFSNEKINPPINDALFKFKLPPGAEFIDTAEAPRG